LTQADIVAYLRTRPNQTSTTKEVLTHFRKAIKGDARNKASIGGLLRAAANLVDGNLVLKPGL
jgi:transcription initiation factor TFIIF subunit alpha